MCLQNGKLRLIQKAFYKYQVLSMQILTIPNPVLRQKSLPVSSFDDKLLDLVLILKKLLEQQKDPPGFGLSAPQIGVLKRVFVGLIGKDFKAFVNPEILEFGKESVTLLEGCLSIPEFYGHVIRPAKVRVCAFTEFGKKFTHRYSGISARVVQHELDHLNGILFIDHVHTQGGKLFKVVKDQRGKEQLAEVTFA